MQAEFPSARTHSRFVVSGSKERAYLAAEGEAAMLPKVRKQIEQVRIGGADWATACWMAKQLAATY